VTLATVLAARDPADLEQGFQLLAAQIDATSAAAPVALFLSLSDGQSRASVLIEALITDLDSCATPQQRP
jgi:hypothetical protein